MDRICIHIPTGKLIEAQSGGDDRPDLMEMRLDTLRQNALRAGYQESEVEVRWAEMEEYALLLAPDPSVIAKREAMNRLSEIDLKSIRSIREWIASQPSCPEFIKQYEDQASVERQKLK